MPKSRETMSAEAFAKLPIMFGTQPMAAVIGTSPRYVSDHGEELGGVRVGGKWLFSKSQVARRYGIDLEDATEEVGING